MTMLRTLLALPLLLIAIAGQAGAQGLSLDAISAYLNGITTATAGFTQINDDGTISTGRLYIRRPGRVRFEYDPPNKALVLASAQTVAIFDEKSNQPPEQYPLRKTPLNLILERTVDLSRRDMVVGRMADGVSTTVIAQDPEHPDYGTIALVFSDSPVTLTKWVVTDGSGAQTTVDLGNLKLGEALGDSLFDIQGEIEKRG
jgi:outer membrane lipoprotein-sorting protein